MFTNKILSTYYWFLDLLTFILPFLLGAFLMYAWYENERRLEEHKRTRKLNEIDNNIKKQYSNEKIETMNPFEIAKFVITEILPKKKQHENNIEYEDIKTKFINGQINGKLFLEMTEEALKELGLSELICIYIKTFIKEYKKISYDKQLEITFKWIDGLNKLDILSTFIETRPPMLYFMKIYEPINHYQTLTITSSWLCNSNKIISVNYAIDQSCNKPIYDIIITGKKR
ncbi:hypothetical protein RFI_25786 [Reticulomyxa filosa]|uniref:Uncharacterized protein n=1 Tax=Reticulomyxa filosa TaxID=46433 RepID=X6MD43_RETFI|nr:hypothetical protein RFI_25786 [Reticulomyxa filosa]|eukprot:ETO11591.1 hypothetical protein RFI_25786 [Reticulomyxa filosa]